MFFSTDINVISRDFGNFPEGVISNRFGYFHSNAHVVSVYMGTNCGIYYATQCQQHDCPGSGRKTRTCPHYLPSVTSDRLLQMIQALLDSGFKYQMIDDTSGCTYFKNGQLLPAQLRGCV